MPLYRSAAKDSEGRKYAGMFEAADRRSALEMLRTQGFIVQSLEEVSPEGEAETAPSEIRKVTLKAPELTGKSQGKALFREGRKNRGLGILKALMISMAVLGTIPVVILVFRPQKPEGTPEETLRTYYSNENAAAYEAQFDLLSSRYKGSAWQKAEDYAASRKQEALLMAQEGPVAQSSFIPPQVSAQVPVLDNVRPGGRHDNSADFEVTLHRGRIEERYYLGLVVEDLKWRIEAIRLLERKTLQEEEADPEPIRTLSRPVPPTAGKAEDLGGIKKEAYRLLDQARRSGKISEPEYQRKKREIDSI